MYKYKGFLRPFYGLFITRFVIAYEERKQSYGYVVCCK